MKNELTGHFRVPVNGPGDTPTPKTADGHLFQTPVNLTLRRVASTRSGTRLRKT